MKYLVFIIFSVKLMATLPTKYQKSSYTEQKVERHEDEMLFSYKFKDHKNQLRDFTWRQKLSELERLRNLFGVGSKKVTSNNELQEGYLTVVSKLIEPDYSRLVMAHKGVAYPIYKLIKDEGLSNREELVLLLRFLQDYPYGIPPKWHEGRFINGLFTPVHSMLNKWADCDSKTLWMASVLANHPYYYNKMAIIHVPGHALLGIEDVPRPYEKYIEYQGKKFVYVEPVGLLRTEIGQTNSPYSISIELRPLNLTFDKPIGVEVPESLAQENCPEGTFLLDYKSDYDKMRTVSCKQKVGDRYETHGWEYVYDVAGNLKSKNRYEQGRLISSTDINQNPQNLQACETDFNLVKYALPGSNLSSESCVKLEAGKVIRHGTELIRNPAGEIVKRKLYDKGILLKVY